MKGHGRLQAAKLLGLSEYPIEYQYFMNEDEEMAALLADNKIAEFSEIDGEMLREIFNEFEFEDLTLTGYSQEDLQMYFSDIEDEELPDDIPLDKEKAGSTTLDFLAYGNVKIILTEYEKTRFDNFVNKYGDANGNLFGLIAELLDNGAKNYED